MIAALAYPTWDQVDQGCSRIVTELFQRFTQDKAPTVIVGLARGGLVPAVRISHLYHDTPILTINYSAKNGRGDTKHDGNDLTPGDALKPNQAPAGTHVLIVDDLVDSGHTMKDVADMFVSRGCVVTTAVLHAKEGSVIMPDIVWQHVPHDGPWIHYPWDL